MFVIPSPDNNCAFWTIGLDVLCVQNPSLSTCNVFGSTMMAIMHRSGLKFTTSQYLMLISETRRNFQPIIKVQQLCPALSAGVYDVSRHNILLIAPKHQPS